MGAAIRNASSQHLPRSVIQPEFNQRVSGPNRIAEQLGPEEEWL
jgi:hypothetical protein